MILALAMNEFNAIVTEQVPAGPAEGFLQRVRIHSVDGARAHLRDDNVHPLYLDAPRPRGLPRRAAHARDGWYHDVLGRHHAGECRAPHPDQEPKTTRPQFECFRPKNKGPHIHLSFYLTFLFSFLFVLSQNGNRARARARTPSSFVG